MWSEFEAPKTIRTGPWVSLVINEKSVEIYGPDEVGASDPTIMIVDNTGKIDIFTIDYQKFEDFSALWLQDLLQKGADGRELGRQLEHELTSDEVISPYLR